MAGSSLAQPIELANRPPSTLKRTKKAYGGLGHGTPSSRGKAMAASTMFVMKPGPDRSCSPVCRPSGRSASRSSSYCGIPIDSLEKGPVALIDYLHYELDKLTIVTRESSLLHLVPQVLPCPSSFGQSERSSPTEVELGVREPHRTPTQTRRSVRIRLHEIAVACLRRTPANPPEGVDLHLDEDEDGAQLSGPDSKLC